MLERKKWEREQRTRDEAREAKQQANAERQQEIEQARARRSEQTAKLHKKTKRGQPVLSSQMDRMLAQIERSAKR
mgnify:FL=1